MIAAAVGPLRLSVTAQEPTPARFAADTMLWRRMLAAEDTRGRGAEGLAPLRAGLRAADAELRAWAVRALGRLEADSLLPEILASLDDVEVDVRAQAANAAAQAVVNGDPQRARAALLERAKRETDPWVLGVVAESLGRLAAGDSAEVDRTAEALLGLSRAPGTDADAATEVPPVQLVGVVKGLYFLARQAEAGGVLPASVVLRLVELTAYGLDGPLDVAAPDLAEAPGDTAAETGARTDTASGASADTVPGIGVAETVGAGQDTVKRAARRVRTVA
ncbi:MAG: HEAT repeat domain-containing protein, partial [Longimicrobiales bacterium]